ncbi:hypothetical protein I6E68_00485 [Salinibacterium sp. NSLL150]|uniref:hypothetical protein n=1 Tax=unclassified Salinibacterium TaxID=2632331 RepID=UPI0018CD08E3|nr:MULTISPECIES: hypothetical protein [unclassified Salinibacterium]MBH0097610.1 hypothetical protein [Salinibacterium sp. NSLL35]MBH0100365.1 hypothetical protein [Salinibacterium sp. NSLL150]MBH0103124.1 hypothetical protein [Salinibacterium sp. NSLL16]MBH0105885.1 hypothetical protein [Salinibacterium sp. NSLL17]MBH0110341.1 hypothetical protein [Salinibacterium sp. NG22]
MHPRRNLKDIAAVLGCIVVALALGTVLVVLGTGSTGSELLHAFARATAVGLPVAALFGVPTWLWLSARLPARALPIALFIALSPLFGIVPGVAVLVTGLIFHLDSPVFLSMFMIAAGAWTAPLATALYYLVLGKRPRIAISLGGIVVVLALLGWVSIWLSSV